ncbi:DUF488 domain-containing protein [Massilia pseudoviolaceinigra]|uniref:DUF488 domain-containing protein n=1 Tax=Massilia pseudoviolaceinigra TaxID=3057165 RepID=UPI002796642A|nr:DUF488 domain-containing protein [Massilia sp. CCM 9206]MDQ1922235.1 DUF488 domain-containing protein [Massilia sp. CCM 9206]
MEKPSKVPPATPTGALVCTIGHSNRPLVAFLDLLAINEIGCVVDVRTVPRSRHNPQFGQHTLPHSLAAAGINYRYMQALGGLRRAAKDSPNTGWRNASFRGYADHMQSAEFAEGLEVLSGLAQKQRCALMCAEAVPWRCHRSMIGDALLVRHIGVEHIIGPTGRRPHALTPFAHVDGKRITYPAPPAANADD